MCREKVIESISHGIIAGLLSILLDFILTRVFNVEMPALNIYEIFIGGFAVSIFLRSFSSAAHKSKKAEISIKIEKNGQQFQCVASGEKEAVEMINRVLADREK